MRYLIACLLCVPLLSFSAGLGRVNVSSALGEPLSAEIELNESTPGEVTSLTARIASPDEYAANGLQDAYVPAGIKVAVINRTDNIRVIKVTTDRPVNEPFLELLIKADSPTVNLMRQYTVLLDPPVSSMPEDADKKAKKSVSATSSNKATVSSVEPQPIVVALPITSAESSASAAPIKKSHKKHKTVEEAPAPTATKVPVENTAVDASSNADSYLTQVGDVFGKVAQRYQPAGVSLKKVMAAFYDANPDAFVNGDMNHLKVGQLLKVPTQEAMASAIVKKDSAPSKKPQVNKADTNTVADTSKDKFVLKISPGDTDASHKDEAAKDSTPSANASSTSDASANAASAPATAVAQPTAAPESAKAEAPAQAEPTKVESKPVVVQSNAEQASWFEFVFTNIKWILIAILLPLLLVALYLINKRKVKDMHDIQQTIDHDIGEAVSEVKVTDSAYMATTPAVADGNNYDIDNMTNIYSSLSKTAEVAAPAVTQLQETEIDIHEVDPLVEAEIYVSYGRFEQAVAILKNALIKNPNKHDVSLALLRILFDRKERGAFDTYASKVYEAHKNGSLANPVMWETIASMGIQLDAGNPIYQSATKETKAAAPDISIAPIEAKAQSHVMEFVLDDAAKPDATHSQEKLDADEELFPKKSN